MLNSTTGLQLKTNTYVAFSDCIALHELIHLTFLLHIQPLKGHIVVENKGIDFPAPLDPWAVRTQTIHQSIKQISLLSKA